MVSANSPREIELKLEIDPAVAPDIKSELVGRFGPAESVTLLSVYYDTPERALRAAGVSLRVRTGDGPAIQTVKRAASARAGLFDRDEWETPLDEAQPDLPAFADTPAGQALAIDLTTLSPLFETMIERTVWHSKTADSDVEIAFDSGLAAAGGRTDPFAEIELELKTGDPRHLFQALHKLEPNGRLRPGVLTKSERGYRLADTKQPPALKAEPLRLGKRMTAAEAFQAVAHACLRHFWLNEPLLVETRAPEALHQTRVALRRFRSALSLFKPVVDDQTLAPIRSALKHVSRHLGAARNLDVYLKTAAGPEIGGGDEPGGRQFLDAIEARRTKAYDEVVARLRSAAFRGTMLDLLAWIEAGPWLTTGDPRQQHHRDRPIRAFAAAVLDEKRRRIKRRGRHLDTLDPETRHRIRIEAKKLRYASEFFAGLTKGAKSRSRQAAFTHALEDLQEQLGALNDIATGHEIAQEFAQHESDAQHGLIAAVQVDDLQNGRMDALVAAAAEAHDRFAATKRFWAAWPR